MTSKAFNLAKTIRNRTFSNSPAIDFKKVSKAINVSIIECGIHHLYPKDTLGFIAKPLTFKKGISVSNTLSKEYKNVVSAALLSHYLMDTKETDGFALRRQDLDILFNSTFMTNHREFIFELLTPRDLLTALINRQEKSDAIAHLFEVPAWLIKLQT